jgi:anti-sigma regulatory factor (Ser/Thr protein kinase)
MIQDAHDPRCVLLALGDTTVAHAFARILDGRQHSSFVAESTLEALEAEPSDTFIADLTSIPSGELNVGGLDLLEDLQSFGLFPCAIMIAAESSTAADYERAARLGVTMVLDRPLRPEDLVEAVETNQPDASDAELYGEVPYVRRDATPSPMVMKIVLAAEDGAAEAAARDLVGWCARCEVVPSTRARIGTSVAEAIQNGVEHGAHRIEVTAELDRSTLTITVDDDGPGFDTVEALTEGRLDSSTGLGRMHSLAESVSIRSASHAGTSVALEYRVTSTDFEDEARIDLSELDFFSPDTSKELLATLSEDPEAPVILSPALAVVVGRLLMGPDPSRVLSEALWS